MSTGHTEMLRAFIRDPSPIDRLLEELDKLARGTCIESGLPIWSDGEKARLRFVVLRWIESLSDDEVNRG